MRFLMLSLSVVFGVGAAVAACGGSDETGGSFCEAGAFVFCRCSNGDAGSKECNSEGTEFGQCMSQDGGECPERDDAASSGDPTSSGDPSSSSSTGAGGATGDGALFAACESADQCQSGDCHPDGYCTQQCANYEECKWPLGDCPGSMAPPALVQTCVPTCGVFNEATKMFEPEPAVCEPDLYCGYTTAADNFGILVCGSRGSWADGIPLPPDGSECDSDTWGNDQCSLGYSGAEAVCTGFGVCAVGCYENGDCPQGETCSQSNGTLGSCK